MGGLGCTLGPEWGNHSTNIAVWGFYYAVTSAATIQFARLLLPYFSFIIPPKLNQIHIVGSDVEEEFVFTLPSERELDKVCSALVFCKADGAVVHAGESSLGAAAVRWPAPPLEVDANSRQRIDGSRHRSATTPIGQSPTTVFSRRISLVPPTLVWSSWRARDADPEGEIGRALLDMLGLWSTSETRPYEVKVS